MSSLVLLGAGPGAGTTPEAVRQPGSRAGATVSTWWRGPGSLLARECSRGSE